MKSTTEIYGGLNVEVFLKPRITWYRDVNAVEGNYIQLGLEHAFENIKKWDNGCSLDLSLSGSIGWASSGYNKGYFKVDARKFNDLSITIGVPIQMKSFSISPSLNISTMLSNQIGNAAFERNNVWFGLGILKEF
jgi:hypothetical protein